MKKNRWCVDWRDGICTQSIVEISPANSTSIFFLSLRDEAKPTSLVITRASFLVREKFLLVEAIPEQDNSTHSKADRKTARRKRQGCRIWRNLRCLLLSAMKMSAISREGAPHDRNFSKVDRENHGLVLRCYQFRMPSSLDSIYALSRHQRSI